MALRLLTVISRLMIRHVRHVLDYNVVQYHIYQLSVAVCGADKLHNFVWRQFVCLSIIMESSHSNIVKHCQTWPTCLSEGEDEVIAAE